MDEYGKEIIGWWFEKDGKLAQSGREFGRFLERPVTGRSWVPASPHDPKAEISFSGLPQPIHRKSDAVKYRLPGERLVRVVIRRAV